MEMIYCPECGKKTPFRDEFAGKNLKCSCGQTFQAPSKKIISNQNPAIPPLSIKNPANPPKPPSVPTNNHGSFDPQLEKLIAIALKDGIVTDKERQILIKKAVELGLDADEFEMELDSRIPTKSVDQPLMNIGNDNIVKANIKGDGNSGSVSGMPLMNIGNDNVINAKIDASTNITHDNSLNVKGTYVASQIVINETAGSALIKLLTGKLTTEAEKLANEEINKLPDDPNQLEYILAKTLRHTIREAKIRFKEGGEVRDSSFADRIKSSSGGLDSVNEKRLQLIGKILDKLHDIGSDSKNIDLVSNTEKLDDCLIDTRQLLLKLNNLPQAKMFLGMGIAGLVVYIIMGFLIPPALIGVPFFGAFAFYGYWSHKKSLSKIQEKLTSVEEFLNDLIARTSSLNNER
jgi:hypothetical protein